MTNMEDCHYASVLGVDMVGFIFAKTSPRYIGAEEALKLSRALPPLPLRVGVFVDEDIERVSEVARRVGLGAVQLHGREEPEYCEKLALKLPCVHLIKAFRVNDERQPDDFIPYNGVADAFLLDTFKSGTSGGTGLTFDWSLLRKFALQKPFFLAGGLAPGNIEKALVQTAPFAVDVNSGVEREPGIKDPQLLAKFMAEVQRWNQRNRGTTSSFS
ncbi:unnamed protein product, partial [Cyprideis torosa]